LTVVRIFEAIADGALPEWEFGVRAFGEEKAASLHSIFSTQPKSFRS